MSKSLLAWAAASALVGASASDGLAQGTAVTGEKVPGTQLQAWLNQQFSYAGVHLPSKCVILNVAQANGRLLFIRCPNGWADKLSGSARVVGDSYCTSFPVPNGAPGEDCVTWYNAGPGRYEQRKGDAIDTSVILLPEGLSANR